MKKNSVKLRTGLISGALTLSMLAGGIGVNDRMGAVIHDYQQINCVSYSSGKTEYRLPGIVSRNIWRLNPIPIKINGRETSDKAVTMNGITYLPLRAVANALGSATVSYDKSTRTATLKMNGLHLTATDGGFVTYANDRPLFSPSPNVLMSNGRMYIPAEALCKALGIDYSVGSEAVSLTGKYSPLTPAAEYYREDEVYWLSKIITAESAGEPLIGQIAVGNVILNRQRSPLYPSTIYGVIFDRKHGVQFSPVLDGSIYDKPTYTATLAAKICLEGTSLSDGALFFLNPEISESKWIIENCEYAFTIGSHDFYK